MDRNIAKNGLILPQLKWLQSKYQEALLTLPSQAQKFVSFPYILKLPFLVHHCKDQELP